MRNSATAAIAATLLAIGIGVGYGMAHLGAHRARDMPAQGGTGTGNAPAVADVAPDAQRRVLYWYDPMYPQQKFDRPGKSPYMDMALVPKYADADSGGVAVDPQVAQSLGLRLAAVTRESIGADIKAVATVGYNERDVSIVQARTAGFVERVYARAPGDVVAANAALADVLVPEWAGAQAEFLAVKSTGDASLAQAAKQRLRLLGMSEALIAQVERTGSPHAILTITSPASGVIQELGIRAGMSVTPGVTLARVNGIGTVWLEAAVPELHAASLQIGRAVRATFAAYADETFTGRIAAVLPEANRETRTLRVRMEFANPKLKLKPGMFGEVAIAGRKDDMLVVPSEAVVRTGTRALVFVADGKGRFRPVEIVAGREVDGKLVVRQGLDEGQQVVASGQFLIDSEANLRGLTTAASNDPRASHSGAAFAEAAGTIVDIGKGQITIAHGPVPALDWPSMTMSFAVDAQAVAGLRKGDRVAFGFDKTDAGYAIRSIAKQGSAS